MNLYRIISLESFIDLLHNKRERYVRPATWEDTFEGYLYSKLYDEKERKKIVEDIYYNVCPRNYKGTIDNILRLEHAKWFVYGQSWSNISESDAMWRIYSYNNQMSEDCHLHLPHLPPLILHLTAADTDYSATAPLPLL